MSHFKIPGLSGEWVWDEGDPEEMFFLEEEIAAGAFGIVYKGIHNETGEVAAVKITKTEGDDEISDYIELTVLRKCNHPNIIKYIGCWRKGGETFMALEYCGGGALNEFYQVWGIPWNEDQISWVMRESLKGLQYMHSIGLIHRDIKGGNILLTEKGDVKLIDFGVSAILTDPNQKRHTLIGTPLWMAPEVIANKTKTTPYTCAVDIWSIGITALELAEKDPPLHQMNPMRALMQIPLRNPPKLQEPEKWSADFANFIGLCLNKDPSKRATIETLLAHPFLLKPVTRDVMLPLIERAAKEKTAIMAAEYGETQESATADTDVNEEGLAIDVTTVDQAEQVDQTDQIDEVEEQQDEQQDEQEGQDGRQEQPEEHVHESPEETPAKGPADSKSKTRKASPSVSAGSTGSKPKDGKKKGSSSKSSKGSSSKTESTPKTSNASDRQKKNKTTGSKPSLDIPAPGERAPVSPKSTPRGSKSDKQTEKTEDAITSKESDTSTTPSPIQSPATSLSLSGSQSSHQSQSGPVLGTSAPAAKSTLLPAGVGVPVGRGRGGPPSRPGGPVDHGRGRGFGGSSASSPSSPSPQRMSGSGVGGGSPLPAQATSNSGFASTTPSSSTATPSPAGVGRGRGRIGAGGRGVGDRRAAVHKTVQQQEMQEAVVANQKLMKRQMEALRAEVKKNEQELERLRNRDAEKEAALSKKNAAKLSKLKMNNNTQAQKLTKQQDLELQNHDKKHAETTKSSSPFI
eukprot:TRINITY_DN3070_c0_g1_i4.p1 TRINITY_DN3070_c0_g1~~TRINITY_DN3070_c0_g1_i4.p1  ORF type:complete len:743 (-),score=183.51 TRINITY_DN3070_c0_g1_i4:1735-3963(-)